MPLKIVASRNKKTKSLYIRGSYLGVAVDKSCRTDRRSVARELLRRLERAIERGEYPTRELPCNKDEKTFLSAANAYMEAGRRTRYVASLIRHFGETSLAEINQDVIDRAAIVICPNAAQVVHQLFFSPHH
jgi:hypothetical protein